MSFVHTSRGGISCTAPCMELPTTSYPLFDRKIHAQMMRLFAASGFTPEKDVAGLILNRWGHALAVPFPGFFGGASSQAPRDVIRKATGGSRSRIRSWSAVSTGDLPPTKADAHSTSCMRDRAPRSGETTPGPGF